jgi:glucose/mannose-6-phosphate isomerase
LLMLEKLGIIKEREPEKDEALALLRALREEWNSEMPLARNQAKGCALRLKGRIPVIYGSNERNAAVARRWKCQLNENEKMVAYCDFFPELNHNEVVGWSNPHGDYRNFHVIMLRDVDDHPRIQRRVEVTREILQAKTTVEEIWTQGKTPMAKLLSLVFLGDLVSVYSALLNGVNPTSIEVIDRIKEKLSEFREEAATS